MLVTPNAGGAIIVGHHQVGVSVAVEITRCNAARRQGRTGKTARRGPGGGPQAGGIVEKELIGKLNAGSVGRTPGHGQVKVPIPFDVQKRSAPSAEVAGWRSQPWRPAEIRRAG